MAPYVAAKGSIALDGVSLTVNEVEPAGRRRRPLRHQHHPAYRRGRPTSTIIDAGDRVNIEIDILARYIGRMLEARQHSVIDGADITLQCDIGANEHHPDRPPLRHRPPAR